MGRDEIRKKFMDILFEPDDEDEIVEEGRLRDIKINAKKTEDSVKHLSAKEVLYKSNTESKTQKSNAFIDYVEKKNTDSAPFVDNNEEYEFHETISPIFGVVNNDNSKVTYKAAEAPKETVLAKSDSHLDIIPSPFFGYGEQKHVEEEENDLINSITESPFEDTRELTNDEDIHFINEHDDETYVVDQEISLFDDSFGVFGDK